MTAIGHPYKLGWTITQGIISGVRKKGKLLQTDAGVSPGNSGGPLFNMKGEVIGVTNMKILSILNVEGLGFAIPVNVVKWFLETRNAFAFDPENPNAGFRYHSPSTELKTDDSEQEAEGESN